MFLFDVSVFEVTVAVCSSPRLCIFSGSPSQLPHSLHPIILEGSAVVGTLAQLYSGFPERTRQDSQCSPRPPGYAGKAVAHAHVCSLDEENFEVALSLARALWWPRRATMTKREAGPVAAAEVKSLPGWGVCLDWRREAAGEARVERGSGAACGDPRRPTGFVGCRPRCRALGEGFSRAERREGCGGPAVEGQHLGDG